MKNPVEIFLTSDLIQHSSSFEPGSPRTQEPVGISNVGHDTLFHFPNGSHALLLYLFPLSHFQISLQYAVLCISQEGLCAGCQSTSCRMDWLPATHPAALSSHYPSTGREGENKIKKLAIKTTRSLSNYHQGQNRLDLN